jgi:hypothetical protein
MDVKVDGVASALGGGEMGPRLPDAAAGADVDTGAWDETLLADDGAPPEHPITIKQMISGAT